ncbi:hypothetical protein RJ641_001796 [Dillenia turbinata]|uniref:Uncharacterized protein n=1 Tax=Dillenia turbinata TaxID=194707 RepID=A0AAN8VRQ0_9MAGN
MMQVGTLGCPLMDSNGYFIGVNTTSFTPKGTGVTTGVNFVIPIDIFLRTVLYLILYKTLSSDRYRSILCVQL